MATTRPVVDIGVGELLDPVLGRRLGGVRGAVDDRFGIRVDEQGVTVRRPWWTTHLAWTDVGEVRLDNRLDRLATLGMSVLPVGRIPVAGTFVARATDSVVGGVTRTLLPGLRARSGWVVATFTRPGWRPDVDLDHGIALAALLRPSLTRAVEELAADHDVPVVHD